MLQYFDTFAPGHFTHDCVFLGQVIQFAASKVDNKPIGAVHITTPNTVTVTYKRSHRVSSFLTRHRFIAKGKRIIEPHLRARFDRPFRSPECHDIVVHLRAGRNFNQHDLTFAPVTLGFDPGAWPFIVTGFQIFELAEIRVALHEAKAAHIFSLEITHAQIARVNQRSPQPFSRFAVMHKQTIRIMNLRAPLAFRLNGVFAVVEHAGERCHAQQINIRAEEKFGRDINTRAVPRVYLELIGASHTRPIQQAVHSH